MPDPTASTPIFDELRREFADGAIETGRDATPGEPATDADRQDAAGGDGSTHRRRKPAQ